jgi:hypothetical protein
MSKFGVSVRLLDATDKVFREVYFKQYALKSKLLSIEKDIVLERVLEGFSAVVGNQPILPTDNIIQAFCKIQSTINYIMTGGFAQLQSDWAQTNNLLVDFIKNKPTALSQFINDTGFITIAAVPTDISDLTDITGIIPTNTNDLINGAGFITLGDIPFIPSDISDLTDSIGIIPTDTNDLTNGAGFITITDIPFIPTDVADLTDSTGIIPTDTGDLTNGAGFITASDIPPIPSDLTDLSDTTEVLKWENDGTVYIKPKSSKLVKVANIEGTQIISGFPNRTDSVISMIGTAFTITPAITNYTIWVGGVKFIITTSLNITISNDKTLHYVYFDSNGALQVSTSVWNIESDTEIPVAIVFRQNSTTFAITDERHGYRRNRTWHQWAHMNIGAMYKSGLTGTFTNTTLSITQGVIYDEDIKFDTLATKTTATIWNRDGVNPTMSMQRGISTPYPVNPIDGVMQYDNGGTLANVSTNHYVAYWIYCSNDPIEPIYIVAGQTTSTNINTIRNIGLPEIRLSTAEWKLLYKVIYRNVGGTTPTYTEALDYRSVQTGTPIAATSISDHTSLINRDASNSHPIAAITDLETTLANITIWNATTTYNIDAIVGYNGVIYISLQNTNLNKTPSSEITYWKEYTSGGSEYWTEIELININTTPASTTTITTLSDLTSSVFPGNALKYKIAGTWYYGAIKTVTSNLITIFGESLSGTIQELRYGKTPYIGGWNILPQLIFYGSFADADNATLIITDILTQILGRTNFKLIGARFYCTEKDSAASPTTQATVTVVNSSAIFTPVELVNALTWYYTTLANTSYTAMSNSQAIEISVTAATGTSNKDAKNLTVEFYCVKTDLE